MEKMKPLKNNQQIKNCLITQKLRILNQFVQLISWIKSINLVGLVGILFLVGCQVKTTRTTDIKPGVDTKYEIDLPTVKDSSVDADEKTIEYVPVQAPKFGFIFSAGGARTWAFVPFLKELQQNKVPVVAVAGVEWGAVVAGIYAHKISANEVEWELSKFKSIKDWNDYIKQIFERRSVKSNQIPFYCSSYNLKTNTSYVLGFGQMDQVVPLCLPSAGIIRPYQMSMADLSNVDSLVEKLKAAGANKIIYVSVINPSSRLPFINPMDSVENQIWSLASSQYRNTMAQHKGIDDVIFIDVNSFKVNQFSDRKNILDQSRSKMRQVMSHFLSKYSL